jgi:hypothetical protein
MPVVINEFEVVPAAAPKEGGEGGAAGGEKPAAAGGPTPQDIERMMRRAYERAMRLRAH